MKIILNDDVRAFLKRCENNMRNDYKNDFIDFKVRPRNEREVQKQLRKAGFGEFLQPESQWLSLFLSSERFKKTAYHQNIKLDQLVSDDVKITREIIPHHRLMNVAAIQWDEQRELNDWMILRALDAPLETTVLSIDEQVWMLDIFSEAYTIDPLALKAHGHVLTFGLGIGYFIYMALENKKVESITVVENNKAVIDLFKEHILPQFKSAHQIKIIEADAFDYYSKENLSDFDYVFVDVHQSNDDGLIVMDNMLSKYVPALDKIDFWIEDSILEILIGLVFFYFNALAYGKAHHHDDPYFNHFLQKIAIYFNGIDEEVTHNNRLKHYLYDRQTLRAILSVSL